LRIPHFAACLLLVLGCLVSVADAQTLRTVALSEDTPPGASNGVRFSQFSIPVLNNAGQVAFRGNIFGTGVGLTNNSGIWSEGSGSLALVTREGDGAPGSSRNFSGLSNPVLNNTGQTAFSAFFADSAGNSSNSSGSGIWSEGGSSLALVARTENAAPGISANFSGFDFSRLTFNDAGQSAFRGFLADSEGSGIWSEVGGSLNLVVRTGDGAPGTSVNFSDLGNPVLNGAGQTAFVGFLTGSGVSNSNSNNTGIWSEGSGILALVTREGDGAPGISAKFSGFGNPVLNSTGQTAFIGSLADSEGNNIGLGIWSEGGGFLALVTRTGDEAPGTSENFSNFRQPVLNSMGQTAFIGFLAGSEVNSSNNTGIWSEGDGSLALVARADSEAPGTSAKFSFFDISNSPTLNGAGRVAFRGELTGPGVNFDNDGGIWAQDLSGALRLIVREGDMLDVDDGPGTDFRMVSTLDFGPFEGSGNEDGRASSFNDLGQVAFSVIFADRSRGIFVSNLVAIPEPSTLLLAALVGAGILLKRRR